MNTYVDEQSKNRAPPKIIPFYALRLRDLIKPKARLGVMCGFCKAEGELDVVKLVCDRGPDFDIRMVEKVLRCRQCNMIGWTYLSLKWL